MIKSKLIMPNLACFVNHPVSNLLHVHYLLIGSVVMIWHVSDSDIQLQQREALVKMCKFST